LVVRPVERGSVTPVPPWEGAREGERYDEKEQETDELPGERERALEGESSRGREGERTREKQRCTF